MRNVSIYNESKIKLNKRKIHSLINDLVKELKLKMNFLEVNIVNNDTIIGLNKEYLRHNYSTDIITFDYSNNKNILDGEIFISSQDASANSKKFKVSVDNELSRLVIHGILHLIGYDDITVSKRKKMKIVEDYFVNKLKHFSKGITVKQ